MKEAIIAGLKAQTRLSKENKEKIKTVQHKRQRTDHTEPVRRQQLLRENQDKE